MKSPNIKRIGIIAVAASLSLVGIIALCKPGKTLPVADETHDLRPAKALKVNNDAAKQKPALTVTTTKPQPSDWPITLAANGNVAAWQEAVIGTELNGLRLTEVLVNVGDTVRRGQTLARFKSDSVSADVAQQKAAVEEARAALEEAQSNAARTRVLADSGALSAQQIHQYVIAERSARARLSSAQAKLQSELIREQQTQVTAPDDGIISARNATVGTVAQQGQELFKLIRKNRLEWRAEVTSSELPRIQSGQAVKLTAANGAMVKGKVRMIAPTVDPHTRNAMVYVDLPARSPMLAGMFATGQFELGRTRVLTVPQSAIVMRDGFSFVYRVGPDARVAQTKVVLGRRIDDRVEVRSGATADTTLVAQGSGFLADGDTVRIMPASLPAALKRSST